MKKVDVVKIFIASPGDVADQRDEVEDLIIDWNNQHTDNQGIVLLPVRWEKNSTASYRTNESGQAVINEELVLSSDLLIAIFGNRIGTRTSSGKSGTVEEINVFHEENQTGAGIFFVDDQDVPHELMQERVWVDKYKEHLSKSDKGLYQTYSKRNIQHFINKNIQNLIQNKEPKKTERQTPRFDIFNNIEFDKDEQLLIIFSIEKELKHLGDRWMAEETLNYINEWENKNNIIHYLSDRYSNAIDKLSIKGIVEPVDFTSHGNPRQYSYEEDIYKKFKEIIFQNQDKVQEIKSSFTKIDEEEYSDFELPF